MEVSQKRKERLKAMQIGAAQAERECIQNASNSPDQLLNPLSQPTSSHATDNSSSFSKFDYYTDPMSAFHGNKKKCRNTDLSCPPPVHSNISEDRSRPPFTGPRESLISSIHATTNQFEANHSPNLAPYKVQSHISQNSPCLSPVGSRTLYSSESPIADAAYWNRSTGSSGNVVSYNESPGFLTSPGSQVSGPGGYPGRGRRGNFHAGQGSSPGSYSERGRYGEFPGRGNISMHSGSIPGTYSGRGRRGNFTGRATINTYSGRNNGSGSGLGSHPWSGRRQTCSQENTSASESPHIFYSKAMVEDPWNELEPVICDVLVPFDGLGVRVSSDSWLPKSIAPKKTEVDETSIGKKSELSLAAYLAQSFEDAVVDT